MKFRFAVLTFACIFLVTGVRQVNHGLAAPLYASTFLVNSSDDSGPGSLREAIQAANANPGPDMILIQLDGSLLLESPLPEVLEDLSISAVEFAFIVDGNSQYRIFEVPPGVTLQLIGLELDSGFGGDAGGAVWNAGSLRVQDCFFLGNFADLGGAIYNLGSVELSQGTEISQSNADQGAGIYNLGELASSGTIFSGNSATIEGGAIYNEGTVGVNADEFFSNSASDGAGIFSLGGSLQIQVAKFIDNQVNHNGGAIRTTGALAMTGGSMEGNRAAQGGALALDAGATADVSGVDFTHNTSEYGGAILNAGALTITGSTLSGNHADGNGGAIENSATLGLTSVVLRDNTAIGDGGGLHNGTSGSVVLEAVTLENNLARAGGALDNAGTLNDTGSLFATNQADWGGAIQNAGSLLLQDSQLEENQTGSEGGALYNTGHFSLLNVNLTDNEGSDGGALYNRGEGEITQSRFEHNLAGVDFGGAIYNQNGSLKLTETDFTGNSVQNGGGAIFSSGALEISGGIFSGNTAKWGGAIHNRAATPVVFRNARFENNSAGHWGGAILNDGNLELDHCIFTGNRGIEFSGAVHNNATLRVRDSEFTGNSVDQGEGGGMYTSGRAVITGSTFAGNTAATFGGAITARGRAGDLTLTGVILSQNQAVDGGALYNNSALHLTEVTLSENSSTNYGGGIFNAGSLDAVDSQFLGNGGQDPRTQQGGAVYNDSGAAANFTRTLFKDNFAWYNGGAVASYGLLTASRSEFINNGSLDMGGAVFQIGASATIQETTLSGNSTWNYGGTIYTNSDMKILRSLISHSDTWTGGAIMSGGLLYIENSTIAENLAFFEGGALQNYGDTTIVYSTLAGNSVSDNPEGGVIQNYGTVAMTGSIITGTTSGVSCSGGVTPTGPNLADENSCTGFTIADPMLGPLQDNGGPTFTRALLWGSPALDASPGLSCPPVDQRGTVRPQGLTCDLGAFEAVQVSVAVDIRPKATRNVINPTGAGSVPVAVLSSPGFLAFEWIDPTSLLFGASGWENPVLISPISGKLLCSAVDSNGDRLPDLVCNFMIPGANFTCESPAGILRGQFRDGTWFVGSDFITPLPCP